jgi:hypothetical protein
VFDRILCDAPCSGDGTLRKAPDLWSKSVPHRAYGPPRLHLRVLCVVCACLLCGVCCICMCVWRVCRVLCVVFCVRPRYAVLCVRASCGSCWLNSPLFVHSHLFTASLGDVNDCMNAGGDRARASASTHCSSPSLRVVSSSSRYVPSSQLVGRGATLALTARSCPTRPGLTRIDTLCACRRQVGGLIVYSTCTFDPVQNEAVVAELLRR